MNPSRTRRTDHVDARSGAIDAALVICGHGSHLNPDSSAPVYDHAARIRERGTFSEVREAFWKEEPSLRNALRTVTAADVIVVPLFVSEGYFTDGVIPRELRLHDRASSDNDDEGNDADDSNALDVAKRVWYTDPVGTHPSMTDVIVARAERITGDPDIGSDTGLAVIGHGTERNPKSAEAIRDHAARISSQKRFAEVEALFMDQEPFVDDVLKHFSTRSIVAVPLFIADGFHTREEIPELLGLGGEYPAYENPSDIGSTKIWYAGAVGTEPSFSDVVTERARGALSRVPDADNRPLGATGRASKSGATEGDIGVEGKTEPNTEAVPAREAFVERVDREIEANEASTWGELVVAVDSVTGSDDDGSKPRGSRTYELRHGADRDRDPAALDTHTDPYRAREIARFDDDGEYRPLKSAPTLARGWRLACLDARDLGRALSYFYPASVENWYRERQGRLDVTDYAETAARQTGMYDPVDDLGGNDLDRAVKACCTDDVCLKRRVWGASEGGDDDTGSSGEIDAPPGEGEFPCREPCSLFVAAAREFVLADRDSEANAHEGAQTDTGFVLTETDRADLDAILTELAENPDGATPARDGEASEPTNRYRVRYLREKLRDLDRDTDDAGTPTEQAVSNPGGWD